MGQAGRLGQSVANNKQFSSPPGGEEKGEGRDSLADQRVVNQARQLRRNSTEAERRLWSKLNSMQLDGVKFRRQHPIGPYIIDFVCLGCKLVLEIDGGQHSEDDVRKSDESRTAWLIKEGYQVLRFWNNDVVNNIDGVVENIKEALRLLSPSL